MNLSLHPLDEAASLTSLASKFQGELVDFVGGGGGVVLPINASGHHLQLHEGQVPLDTQLPARLHTAHHTARLAFHEQKFHY